MARREAVIVVDGECRPERALTQRAPPLLRLAQRLDLERVQPLSGPRRAARIIRTERSLSALPGHAATPEAGDHSCER